MTPSVNLRESMQAHEMSSSRPGRGAIENQTLRSFKPATQVPSHSFELQPNLDRIQGHATGAADPFTLAQLLPETALPLPVCDLHLTSRCRNVFYAHGIATLGDLRHHNLRTALRWRNFGVKTAEHVAAALRNYIQSRPKSQAAAARHLTCHRATLLESIVAAADQLPARDRMICRSRLGLEGERESLAELATLCGVTPERVRQLQARIFASIRRDHPWSTSTTTRLEELFGARTAPLPLNDLEALDGWFAVLRDRPEVLRCFLAAFAADQFCLTSIEGEVAISRVTGDASS